MNIITIIILSLVIFIMVIISLYNCKFENFTSDEAIKNVATLYNQAKLTITDLVATNSAAIPTLTGGNANFSGGVTANALTAGSATVNSNLAVKGSTWLKGNAAGDTVLGHTDGNNYLSGNNNILRGGPTTVQGTLASTGDLNVGGTTNLAGNVNINNKIRFRVMDNVAPAGGWDLGDFQASSAADCANQCMRKYNSALNAAYRKNDRHCWCKTLMGVAGNDSNWTTTLFI